MKTIILSLLFFLSTVTSHSQIQTINNGESGSTVRNKLNSNFSYLNLKGVKSGPLFKSKGDSTLQPYANIVEALKGSFFYSDTHSGISLKDTGLNIFYSDEITESPTFSVNRRILSYKNYQNVELGVDDFLGESFLSANSRRSSVIVNSNEINITSNYYPDICRTIFNMPYNRNFVLDKNGFAFKQGEYINLVNGDSTGNLNLKGKYKINDSTVLYLPNQNTFRGSMYIGNGGTKTITDGIIQGWRNTAIGMFSMYNSTTASRNTAIGFKSMFSNTTGSLNIAVGDSALLVNTTGNNNTAIGQGSLVRNTTGQANLALGSATMVGNTTGNFNTGLGQGCLESNSTGTRNVVVGHVGMRYGTNNNYNTIIGDEAGRGNVGWQSTNYTIKIGYQSGYNDSVDYRLFIEPSNSQTPLIGGKFDEDRLGVNKLITDTWKANLNVGGSIHVTTAIYQDLLTGSLTDGTPTAAQINTITGLTPSTATAGYNVKIKDSDGTGLIYDITSDGTSWHYIARTIAL